MKYGIVQGRLVPQCGKFIQNFPDKDWLNEFQIASRVGCSHIEWIVTRYRGINDNPLMDLLPDDMAYLKERFNVEISAVCYDAILDRERCRLSNHEFELATLATRCAQLGIKTIVLPLLEVASIRLPSMRMDALNTLKKYSQLPVNFSLETDLAADELAESLAMLDTWGDLGIGVTLDTGNLTRLGYDIDEHLAAYGGRIDNVHVKDTLWGGRSVPLGSGNLDLGVLGRIVKATGVERVTFQTARLSGNTDIKTFQWNVAKCEEALNA